MTLLRHAWIGGIWRVARKAIVVVVDLEEDGRAFRFERTEVVFFMWVVGTTEVVINRDGFDD